MRRKEPGLDGPAPSTIIASTSDTDRVAADWTTTADRWLPVGGE